MSKGDHLKMKPKEFSSGDAREPQKRTTREEAERKLKNFRRDLKPPTASDKWITEVESASKSEGTSEKLDLSTPQDGQRELQAIESRYNKRPGRPHEWLTNEGEEGLKNLKAKEPDLVRKYMNQALLAQDRLGKHIKFLESSIESKNRILDNVTKSRSSYIDDQSHQKAIESQQAKKNETEKQLDAAKTLKTELDTNKLDVSPHENLSDKLTDNGKAALDQLDSKTKGEIDNPVISELEALKRDIGKLKEERGVVEGHLDDAKQMQATKDNKEFRKMQIKKHSDHLEGVNYLIRQKESLAKVPALVAERRGNQRQMEALQLEQTRLQGLTAQIPDGQATVDSKQIFSMLGSFSQGVTWSKVNERAKALNDNLQASIDNRATRIVKIDNLLELPPQTKSVDPILTVASSPEASQRIVHDLGGGDEIIEERRE
jgi:hypothetical protein